MIVLRIVTVPRPQHVPQHFRSFRFGSTICDFEHYVMRRCMTATSANAKGYKNLQELVTGLPVREVARMLVNLSLCRV